MCKISTSDPFANLLIPQLKKKKKEIQVDTLLELKSRWEKTAKEKKKPGKSKTKH